MSDTLRERCIEAGRDAMGRNDGWRWWAPRHLGKLFDLWEPMIREQVAREIRAERDQFIRVTRAAADDLPVLAYTDAARIAEEGRNDEA